jgi:hypothetical protein
MQVVKLHVFYEVKMNLRAIYRIPRIKHEFFIVDKKASDKYQHYPQSILSRKYFQYILLHKEFLFSIEQESGDVLSEKEFFDAFRGKEIDSGMSQDMIIENLEFYTINRKSDDLKELGQIPSEDILEINI